MELLLSRAASPALREAAVWSALGAPPLLKHLKGLQPAHSIRDVENLMILKSVSSGVGLNSAEHSGGRL